MELCNFSFLTVGYQFAPIDDQNVDMPPASLLLCAIGALEELLVSARHDLLE
jgi:hypothetical protein